MACLPNGGGHNVKRRFWAITALVAAASFASSSAVTAQPGTRPLNNVLIARVATAHGASGLITVPDAYVAVHNRGVVTTFFAVLVVMTTLGFFFKNEKPVDFESETTMDLTSSKGAGIWGIAVVIVTLILYAIFR